MLKRATRVIAISSLTALMMAFATNDTNLKQQASAKEIITITIEPVEYVTLEQIKQPVHIEKILETTLTEDEIELIALVTMAEAEGECEEGKRLVIDTILNRLDSEHFPDTVEGVIYQANQFTSMWNGRADRCYPADDICQLVREELRSRTNSEVIFFRTGRFSDYGVPIEQVGSHYFSSYD